MNIVPVYNQAPCLLLWSPDTHVHAWTLRKMSLMSVFQLFGSRISKLGKFLLKPRVQHSGKFAPRENNPLYSIYDSYDLFVYTTES